MSASYLKETVEKIARDKKVELVGSMERAVWEADKKLDRGDMSPSEAMEKIKGAIGGQFSGDDYKKIEKEINYNLNK